MQLPRVIQLRAKCNEPCNLSGLIFQMRIQAGTKNSYYIQFPQTSQEGLATILAEDFQGQFEDHHHFGLMDYNGSIGSAVQVVYLDLLDTKRIVKNKKMLLSFPLMPNESKKWKSRAELINYWLSSANDDFFFFPSAVKIEENKIIEVEVGRKR